MPAFNRQRKTLSVYSDTRAVSPRRVQHTGPQNMLFFYIPPHTAPGSNMPRITAPIISKAPAGSPNGAYITQFLLKKPIAQLNEKKIKTQHPKVK